MVNLGSCSCICHRHPLGTVMHCVPCCGIGAPMIDPVIELGYDGAHNLTVEKSGSRWFFCRNGEKIRPIVKGMLEYTLIEKIQELQNVIV
jgi:hypothetical protein